MNRARRFFSFFCCATLVCGAAQTSQSAAKPGATDKAAAYYNFAMGHVYAELAGAYGNRGEYVSKAIEHYKQVMKLDPDAGFLLEDLTELYMQSGQIRTAVLEAEEALKQNPDNLSARRMLGRLYTRLIGDSQQGKVNEQMVRQAIEQYQIIVDKDPKDVDSWITLGRLHRVAQNSVEAKKAFQKALEADANNEDALTGLAMVYSDVGDTKNMVEALRRVADRTPSLRTLTALATAYEQMRDYSNAAEIFRRALALNPGNTQLKRALAQNLLYADQLDDALKLYLELADAEPKDVQVYLRLSEIYRQKRDFTKARAASARAKDLDRNSLEVRYDEVNLLDAEGKTEEAIAALKRILDDTAKPGGYGPSEKGSRAMLLERLGGLYRSAHQTDKALETFRHIAEVAPEAAARAAVHVVETCRMAKDFTRALQESEAARKKYPDDRTVKVVHATLLADLGRAEEGAQLVRGLLTGDRDRETWLTLAQVYEKGKNYQAMDAALAEAAKLSDTKQEMETIHFMRGAMYEKLKKYEESEAEFRKVLEINPQSASALNYLGYTLADRNVRLEEAKELITKALDLDPQNGAYLDSLGWVYYRLNRLEDAETYLRRALDRLAADPTIHDHLGDVYLKQGKLKEAIAQWQLSLREWESSSKSEHDASEVAKVTKKLEGARIRLARESSAAQQKQR